MVHGDTLVAERARRSWGGQDACDQRNKQGAAWKERNEPGTASASEQKAFVLVT